MRLSVWILSCVCLWGVGASVKADDCDYASLNRKADRLLGRLDSLESQVNRLVEKFNALNQPSHSSNLYPLTSNYRSSPLLGTKGLGGPIDPFKRAGLPDKAPPGTHYFRETIIRKREDWYYGVLGKSYTEKMREDTNFAMPYGIGNLYKNSGSNYKKPYLFLLSPKANSLEESLRKALKIK